MFPGIETERLRIRNYTADDIDFVAGLRGDPEVARYQDWVMPYTRERAEQSVTKMIQLGGPQPDTGWNGAVTRLDGTLIGDVYIGFTDGTSTVELGYTFAAGAWGHGYATEAVTAVVEHVQSQYSPTRVHAGLHPDNVASAMVLERCGLVFEGHLRNAHWVDGVMSDDWIYAMTPDDWESWRTRPRQRPGVVELVPIGPDNVQQARRLATHHSQERFVTPVGPSLVDAAYPPNVDGAPLVPVIRLVVADGEPAGFMMYTARTDHHPTPMLWRFLVDRRHQRRGVGSMALAVLFDELRGGGATSVETSWVPGRGTPEPLYLGVGFVPTGEIDEDEIVAVKLLT